MILPITDTIGPKPMSLRQRLLSQSAIVFAARLGGAGLVFIFQAIMARYWGSAALGQYLIAIATANLLAITMPLGFQTIGTYFAADYAARGAGSSLRRFLLLRNASQRALRRSALRIASEAVSLGIHGYSSPDSVTAVLPTQCPVLPTHAAQITAKARWTALKAQKTLTRVWVKPQQ